MADYDEIFQVQEQQQEMEAILGDTDLIDMANETIFIVNDLTGEDLPDMETAVREGTSPDDLIQQVKDTLAENPVEKDVGKEDFGNIENHPEDNTKEKPQTHEEKMEAAHEKKEAAIDYSKNTFRSFYNMQEKYHAYKSGTEVDGKAVGKVDVFISGVQFVNSNIFETLILTGFRAIERAFDKDKADVEKPEGGIGIGETGHSDITTDKLSIKDDVGAYDNGYARGVDKDEVEAARVENSEYGRFFGADTSREPNARMSTENMNVWTEDRPMEISGVNEKGFVESLKIPSMRMVEISGNFYQVNAFGGVEASKIYNHDVDIKGFPQLDVSRDPSIAKQIEMSANTKGVSVEQFKADIVESSKEQFAQRIETQWEKESDRLSDKIESTKQDLDSLKDRLSSLEGKEAQFEKSNLEIPENKAALEEIKGLKEEIGSGIEKAEYRLKSMEAYQDYIDSAKNYTKDGTVEDRFERAVTGEKLAAGRGENVEYLSKEADEKYEKLSEIEPKENFDMEKPMEAGQEKPDAAEREQKASETEKPELDQPQDTEKAVLEKVDTETNQQQVEQEQDKENQEKITEQPEGKEVSTEENPVETPQEPPEETAGKVDSRDVGAAEESDAEALESEEKAQSQEEGNDSKEDVESGRTDHADRGEEEEEGGREDSLESQDVEYDPAYTEDGDWVSEEIPDFSDASISELVEGFLDGTADFRDFVNVGVDFESKEQLSDIFQEFSSQMTPEASSIIGEADSNSISKLHDFIEDIANYIFDPVGDIEQIFNEAFDNPQLDGGTVDDQFWRLDAQLSSDDPSDIELAEVPQAEVEIGGQPYEVGNDGITEVGGDGNLVDGFSDPTSVNEFQDDISSETQDALEGMIDINSVDFAQQDVEQTNNDVDQITQQIDGQVDQAEGQAQQAADGTDSVNDVSGADSMDSGVDSSSQDTSSDDFDDYDFDVDAAAAFL